MCHSKNKRSEQEDTGSEPVNPHKLPHQTDAPHECRLTARMLNGVRHLMRRDCHGGDRSAIMVLRQ